MEKNRYVQTYLYIVSASKKMMRGKRKMRGKEIKFINAVHINLEDQLML